MLPALCCGLGVGIATNQVADDFNGIERRERRIDEYLQGLEAGKQSHEIEQLNSAYMAQFENRLNLYRFRAF